MPHRDRAPQEITPVRVEAASRPMIAAAALDARTMHAARAAIGDGAPSDAAPEPPSMEEIAHDVAMVRRRAFATAAYGAGAVAVATTFGVADPRALSAFAAPAAILTLFCGVATLAGTVWTWAGARRLGEAGISVFDTIDGAWRELAARRAPPGTARRAALAAAHAHGRGGSDAARGGRAPAHVHRVPATPEVLASRWGAAVTRAVDDRAALAHLVDDLGPADRDMIPDVIPTADMLVGRVGELATTLHELDRDAPPSLVAEVEARLVVARAANAPASAAPDPDRARRVELLERQRDTLADLARRREQLAARLEGAALLLQNMRLDLLRLRSAGIESALGELASATREAGALNRDIGRALDVAEELRGRD